MSSGWSSELIVVDHHDINASTMAVDSTGSTALLAGRQWLYLKNLNCPADLLAQYSRKSKFNVKAAEWNPHSQHRDQCAIASGCSVEIRVVTEGSFAPLVTAGNHLRLVSSICWHPSDGQIIVSSSLDKLCRIWDLREPSRPVIAFRSVDVCNEVKCNRADGYLLATSHGGDVRLWDHRKANQPTHYFTISESTIHCLDWSCSNENQLAVGSQDCAVRIVDASSTRHHFTMSMISPVWRASYTPFGMGLLVAGVAGRRRGGDSLQLWSIAAPTAPAHTFLGHSDVVLSYGWRHFRSENSNYQLVTWSRDQTLRLWEIDRYLENMCNSLNEETSIKTDDCEGSQLNFEIECESRGSSVDREANDEDGHASVAMEAEEDGWSDNPDPPIILPSPQDPMTTSMDTEGNSDGSSAPSRRASAATGCRVLTLELAALGDLPDGTIVSVEQSNGEDMNGGEFVHIRLLVAGRNIGIFVVFPSEYPHHAAPTFEFVAAETDLDQATQDRLLLIRGRPRRWR